jgi:acetate CoA/acetoacetate CoA-transferase beta subunit
MTTSPTELIARRVAQEVQPGSLVNLGIGLPTQVVAHLPPGVTAYFLTENGLVGMGPPPVPGMENPALVNAGGEFVSAVPGAASLDSTVAFGLIRGGHLDLAVLGGLQVDARGRLANWMIPGKLVPGMGGAMDLVAGARRVIVAMTHTTKGAAKIVEQCTMPLTSVRPVNLVVTEMAVIEPTAQGLVLRERAPGVSVAEILAATAAHLIVPPAVPEFAPSGTAA